MKIQTHPHPLHTHRLLEINARITPLWTQDLQRINVDTKKIMLTGEDGKVHPMVGGFNHGYFERKSWNSFSAYRPSRWKESKATVPYNAVFLVPKEAGKLTFRIDEVSTEVTLPEKLTLMPVPAKSVTVEVLSAKRVTEIPGGDLSRDVKEKSIIRPLKGDLLEVTIQVTPMEGNSTMAEHFYWNTSWLGLMAGKQGYHPTLGERWGTGISSNVSHNKSNYTGKWSSDKATFYFAVPAGVTDFEITWLLTPVAKGSVGK